MDIKHAVNAMAVVTLGKDMTFRDYAQGTFRMRGIGQGQTIMLYIIPEVLKLIKTHMIAAQTGKQVEQLIYERTISEAHNDHAPVEEVKLEDVSAWLVVNSMRSEKVQFQMLSEQSIENVWRKQAFNALMADWKTVGSEKMSLMTGKSVDVFRDRVDYAVENAGAGAEALPHQAADDDQRAQGVPRSTRGPGRSQSRAGLGRQQSEEGPESSRTCRSRRTDSCRRRTKSAHSAENRCRSRNR